MCNVLFGNASTVIQGKVGHVRLRDWLLIKFQMSIELTYFAAIWVIQYCFPTFYEAICGSCI